MPSKISGSQYQGDAQSFMVTGTVTGNADEAPYVSIVGTEAVFDSPVQITQQPNGEYQAELRTSSFLEVGTYAGTLKVRLCEDAGCAKVSGQDSVDYMIEVLSNTNLTPLASLGTTDWVTAKGNIGRTSYVPVVLDASRFSARWLAEVGGSSDLPLISVAGGTVYATGELGDTYGPKNLDALDEYDGHLFWQKPLGSHPGVSQPTVSGTRLLLAASNFSQANGGLPNPPDFTVLDRSSGETLNQVPFPVAANGGDSIGSPLALNGFGYVSAAQQADGEAGTVAYDLHAGAVAWTSPVGNGVCCGVSPAADGQYVYGAGRFDAAGDNGPGGLVAMDPATGDVAFEVTISDTYGYPPVAPALSGSMAIVGGSFFQTVAIDLEARVVRWSTSEIYFGSPTVAQGAVYLQSYNQPQLEVRSLVDGNLLWTYAFDGEAGYIGSPIVTKNIVFMSTRRDILAINIATHKLVWSYPHPGTMALSANGILYIGRAYPGPPNFSPVADGYIAAINLH